MGCAASKNSVLSYEPEGENKLEKKISKFSVRSKDISLDVGLPNYWGSKSMVLSKEDRENIRNVSQELGI